MAERLVNNIRTLRFLSDEMSQGELGKQVGVTRQTIAAIEQGRYSPSLETALRIARIFGKPVEEIFRWETEGNGS
jgi:putative transcriptional regulator